MDALAPGQRFVFFIILAGLVFLLPVEANASIIQIDQSGGGQVLLPSGEIRSQFLLGGMDDILGGNGGVFDGFTLTATDQGNTFVADQSSDYFDDFVQVITNGIDDRIAYGFSLPDKDAGVPGVSAFYTIIYESDLFGDASQNGIDMQGYQIHSIALDINSFIWDRPGMNPNGDGNWLDYSADMTLTLNPEPATIFFLAVGCLFSRMPRYK